MGFVPAVRSAGSRSDASYGHTYSPPHRLGRINAQGTRYRCHDRSSFHQQYLRTLAPSHHGLGNGLHRAYI